VPDYGLIVRLGVLDIGSNTVHLLVVDAHHGAAPLPMASHKVGLYLMESLDGDGSLDSAAVDRLIDSITECVDLAEEQGVDALIAFATSAIREAGNGRSVLARIRKAAGVPVAVLPGAEEAAATFLAARRWFGWSSGDLLVADIGGGSLELAAGSDEAPAVAVSLPLGAGRLTRQFAHRSGELRPDGLERLRELVVQEIAGIRAAMTPHHDHRHHVATSKSFRQLARINGAPSSSAGLFVQRFLNSADMTGLAEQLCQMPLEDRAKLPGVSRERAGQLPAAAVVAEEVMRGLGIERFELCPWALREGLILRYLETMPWDRRTPS